MHTGDLCVTVSMEKGDIVGGLRAEKSHSKHHYFKGIEKVLIFCYSILPSVTKLLFSIRENAYILVEILRVR